MDCSHRHLITYKLVNMWWGVVFGFATIALFLKIHCLSIVMFLLFTYLVRTSLKLLLNLILHSLNVKACPDCNQMLSIAESSLLSEVCGLYRTSQLTVLVSCALDNILYFCIKKLGLFYGTQDALAFPFRIQRQIFNTVFANVCVVLCKIH